MCVCVCVGQRVMTTTARVITVGFIMATDRAASKKLTKCVRVFVCISGGVCVCVCVCLRVCVS